MEQVQDKIFIQWRINEQDPENKLFELYCPSDDPQLQGLVVNMPMEGNQERSARAKLIEMMFSKAEELGLDVSRLRFHV